MRVFFPNYPSVLFVTSKLDFFLPQVDQLSLEMEDEIRKQMEFDSVRKAAEKLPGRVISHLMEPALQASRSWPSECPPRTVVPRCMVVFVREFLIKMGVEYDNEMMKRLQVCLELTVLSTIMISTTVPRPFVNEKLSEY